MHLPNIYAKKRKTGRFVCAICTSFYRYQSSLKQHVEKKHMHELY